MYKNVFFTCCEIYTGNHQLLQYPRVICILLLRLDQILEISFAETFVWKLKGKIIFRFLIFSLKVKFVGDYSRSANEYINHNVIFFSTSK